MNVNWESWAHRAARHIRFKPDRAPAEEELLAHMEDRAEALIGGGMPVRDAEQAALAAMGDADEVGAALAAVHKPWLGYLWLWSRRVLIVCVLAALIAAFGAADRLPLAPNSGAAEFREELELWVTDPEHYTVAVLDADCRAKSDGFTFTVPRAAVVSNKAYVYTEEYDGKTYNVAVNSQRILLLHLECSRLLPMTDDLPAFRYFYAVDDLGNRYEDFWAVRNDDMQLAGNYSQVSLWRSRYAARIARLDPDASWVELRYDRDGRDVRLRIDLTGGEGQ